jgi:hypothetical protein
LSDIIAGLASVFIRLLLQAGSGGPDWGIRFVVTLLFPKE